MVPLEPGLNLDHYDLSFFLPNGEQLNASRWSSLLKLSDIPVLRVSLNFYSDDDLDAKDIDAMSVKSSKSSKSSSTQGGKVNADIQSLDLDDGTKSLHHGGDDSASKETKTYGLSWSHSRKKFVDFTIVDDVASSRFGPWSLQRTRWTKLCRFAGRRPPIEQQSSPLFRLEANSRKIPTNSCRKIQRKVGRSRGRPASAL